MDHCPQCHSATVHRARTRTLLEKVKRALTSDRLHRCRECGWRGWGPISGSTSHTPSIPAAESPDLLAVDAELERAARHIPRPGGVRRRRQAS